MRDERNDWNQQYQYDRDFMLSLHKEGADKHDKLCDEVAKLQIKYALMWGKLLGIGAVLAITGGTVGGLLGSIVKLLPAILKALQSTPKP